MGMKKKKTISFKSAVWTLIIVIVLIAAAKVLGAGTMGSAIRVGYIGSDGWRNWSASYSMLDGTLKHTIHLKDTQDTVRVEVATEDGQISIQMEGTDGNVIFNEEDIATTTFDVKVTGNVAVRIEADHHKGSFNIETIE